MMLLLNLRGGCGKMNLIWETLETSMLLYETQKGLTIRCRVVRVNASIVESTK